MVYKAKQFFKHVILPELVGKHFSQPLSTLSDASACMSDAGAYDVKNDGAANIKSCNSDFKPSLTCYCIQVFDESDVIGCYNGNCKYVWIHFRCAGIKRVPKDSWFYKDCRN